MITHVKDKALILESIWKDLSFLPLYVEARKGEGGFWLCVWEHEGIGCDYEHRADRQTERMACVSLWKMCVCVCVCVSPQGLQLPLFTGTNLKNTAM